MKKRTKRKIHKRIIKKISSGQPLSKFDRKYHEDMKRKVYIDTAKTKLYADDKLVSTIDGKHQFPVPDFSSQSDISITNLIFVPKAEPSKWRTLKSKVKGWFAK